MILFQGDSITDAGRDRKAGGPNESGALGRGYPSMIAGALLADYPQLQLKVFNRGISGNKVPDLASRWEEDALALRPALLSILVGVNDIWHKLNGNYTGTVQDYETGYRALLQRTLEKTPAFVSSFASPSCCAAAAWRTTGFRSSTNGERWPRSWRRNCG